MVENNETAIREALRDGDAAALFSALGWETVDVDLPPSALPAWGWRGSDPGALRFVARGGTCSVLEHRGPAELRRSLARDVYRHNPHEPVLWLWHDETQFTFVTAARSPSGGVLLRSMSIDRHDPDAMGLDAIGRMALAQVAQPQEVDRGEAMRAHLAEVLGHEDLTRAFFVGFRDAHERLQATIVDGPPQAQDRHDACLVVLLRLVFLYFVQREGLLDGDRRYIVRRLRACLHAEGGFWHSVLHPLFFGALNTEPGERSDTVARLGEIPFLNGGLFEPTPIERRHPDMAWPDGALRDVIEGHFERYHFTAVEPVGEDEARVVDPEMLGKVFEGLMYGSERQTSGSFYTPRDVVRRMVDEALDAYLEAELGCGCDTALRAGREADVRDALSRVTVLDPAVGTGAFLLETLDALRSRRRALGDQIGYAELRQLVHSHLYGVDRQRTAVRLCELRLWLAMFGALTREKEVEPLPNLAHRIAAGDSLLGATSGYVDRGELVVPPAARGQLDALEGRLDELHARYLRTHGEAKRRVRRAIEATERATQERWLIASKEQLLARIEPLARLRESRDLFGDSMANAENEGELARLHDRVAEVDATIEAVRSGRTSETAFAYESRFGRAAREGFHIVITNPPWVRAQRLDARTRARMRDRFRSARNELWPDARRLGIRAPFGTQPDLAALFVERSLELLRPGGHLVALVPAKLFRSLHGAPVRGLMAEHGVQRVEDFSEAASEMFDATTYPAIVRVRRRADPGRPSPTTTTVAVWRGVEPETSLRVATELGAYGNPAEPWLLVPEHIGAIFDIVRQKTVPLGSLEPFEPRRGVFTGANDVFVRPLGGFTAELGECVGPLVRPLLTGSGLGDEPDQEILYPYDDEGTLLTELPDAVVRYFRRHRGRLEARSDHQPRLPLWQLFRVRGCTTAPKVAWRDMSVYLDPVVPAAGAVPLNTVYYLACTCPRDVAMLQSWMASPPVRAFARAIAERARGGWRRHFAWVIRLLPFPTSLAAGEARELDLAEDFGLSYEDLDSLRAWLGLDAPAEREAA